MQDDRVEASLRVNRKGDGKAAIALLGIPTQSVCRSDFIVTPNCGYTVEAAWWGAYREVPIRFTTECGWFARY